MTALTVGPLVPSAARATRAARASSASAQSRPRPADKASNSKSRHFTTKCKSSKKSKSGNDSSERLAMKAKAAPVSVDTRDIADEALGGADAGAKSKKGMFTTVDPNKRRIIPKEPAGRTVVKLVYVVLESQYQSALSDAVRTLNALDGDVCFEVSGYLLEELRSKDNFELFKEDIATANIFIGSLIFIEELAEKVVEVVKPQRDRLDACIVFPSMPAVMKLNKLNSFDLGAESTQKNSAFGEIMKTARNKSGSGFEDKLLKFVRTLPKVLKYFPTDKARDARNWIFGLQYWLGGNSENLEAFLTRMAYEYVPALEDKRGAVEYAEPVLYPDLGIWHPLAPKMYEDMGEYERWMSSRGQIFDKSNGSPTIGLVIQRSHIVTGDDGHYCSMVMELEARGARVVPVFAGGLDFSTPVEKYFKTPSGVTRVDTVISLTGFALVGGPARQDHPKAIETLKSLNVPYMVSAPLVFQTTGEWQDSTLGLHPVQVALQVAIPEIDGGLEPLVFSGRDAKTGKSHSLYDRVASLASRGLRWAELRRKSVADKKIAISVFSFPPDKGNVGTAAYLNVFASIHRVMCELRDAGYDVGGEDFPDVEEELLNEILHDKEAKFQSPDLNVAYRMPVSEYEKLCNYSQKLHENWGPPPGNLNSDGENLLVYGKKFGNVFIGVQPTFGYEGDPMRLLFSNSASPHHGFAAYYTYLEHVFGADACVHFGTHGSLEFMPGKQVGMSETCYPDSLIGSLPNIYMYAANNPSEATVAKRRSYANTISYLTPPAENAGLYKGLKELKDLIASYQSLKEGGRAVSITNSIVSTARTCNLERDVDMISIEALGEEGETKDLSKDDRDTLVGKVYIKLMEIESRLLPCGLHVVGSPPSADEAVATLVSIASIDRPENNPPTLGLTTLLASSIGRDIEHLYRTSDAGVLEDVQLLQEIREQAAASIGAFVDNYVDKATGCVDKNQFGMVSGVLANLGLQKQVWGDSLKNTQFEKKIDNGRMKELFQYLGGCLEQVVKDNELSSLLEALDGQYTVPGPGGDPIRNPKVLPTGKNIHALDPQSIPTSAAVASAQVVVDRLLERQKTDNGGEYPRSIAVVLWGTDNIKTYGESLAQVMLLAGVRPTPDALGRVNKVELIPLEELGRPRIDVVVNCSGVFRDLFINQMALLDRGIKMAAEADEPLEMNFVRAHALEQAAELDLDVRECATRIFSNASGSYSSNVNLAVENSSWDNESQLQDMYLNRKSFAFNSDTPGAGMETNRDVFERALKKVDVTFQNLDSSEISLTDVSHYFDSDPTNLVQSVRDDGKTPASFVADTTTANAQVRTLSETVRLDARTKLLNPKWYEGMLSSGYEGTREIQKRLNNTLGWSATSGQVDNWVYEEANDTFINDPEMAKRLMESNPNSFRKIVANFLEANGRGYWDTSEDNIEKLRQYYMDAEDKIEGVM